MTSGHHPPGGLALRPGPLPLYYQLERHLAERIRAGEFRAGQPLPGEGHLCLQYGVSRITVRRALEALRHDRVIARRRGVGTFVADPQAPGPIQLIGSLDDVLARPGDLSYRVLGRQRMAPPPFARQALGLGAGARVIRLETVHCARRVAFAYAELFFPEPVGQLIRRRDVADGLSMVRLLEAKLGEPVSRAEQTVEAAVADAALARHLRIAVNAPVLTVLRTYYTETDRPVEAAVVRYHPRYRYTVQLFARPPRD